MNKKRITSKGFTLVEIMVVMAIMATMSMLGIIAIIGVSDGAVADRATESVLSQIREAQNKAFSVASVSTTDIDGNPTEIYPIAWGVTIRKSADGSGIQPFYIVTNEDQDGTTFEQVPVAAESSMAKYSIDGFTGSDANADTSSLTVIYTAPFGKYYAIYSDEACKDDNCVIETIRPYDLKLEGGINGSVDVALSFRAIKNTIRIENNGEVSISG